MDDNTNLDLSNPEVILTLTYVGLLIAAGLTTLAFRIPAFLKARKLPHQSLPFWPLRWLDFGVFLWLVFIWAFLPQALLPWLINTSQIDQALLDIINGSLMQFGLIFIFFAYRSRLPFHSKLVINPQKARLHKVLGKTLLNFISLYPIIWISGIVWFYLLGLLKSMGWNISLEHQQIVDYFMEAQSFSSFFTLILLAIVIAPIAEELIFRAGIYRFLKSKFPQSLSILLSSTLFALLHLNIASFLPLIIIGSLLCLLYETNGNLLYSICFHSFFNFNTILIIILQAGI